MMMMLMSVCHRSAEMLVPKVKLRRGYISGKRRGGEEEEGQWESEGLDTYMQIVTQLLSFSLSVFHLSSHTQTHTYCTHIHGKGVVGVHACACACARTSTRMDKRGQAKTKKARGGGK